MCLSTSAPRTQRGIVKVSDLHAVLFSHLLRGVFHALATVDELQDHPDQVLGFCLLPGAAFDHQRDLSAHAAGRPLGQLPQRAAS